MTQTPTLKQKIAYFSVPTLLGLVLSVLFQNPICFFGGLAIGWVAAQQGEQARIVLHREGLLPRVLAPRIIVRDVTNEVRIKPAIDAEVIEEAPAPAQIEAPKARQKYPSTLTGTWAALQQDGFLRPDADFVLAIDDEGQPIRMPKITSLGIGGVPGSGKTVSMVSLVMQAIAKYNGKVKILIIDPHMNSESEDALSLRLLPEIEPYLLKYEEIGPNPVYGGDPLLRWITWLETMVRNKIAGKNDFGDEKVLVVADEFAGLVSDSIAGRPLINLLELINTQARKLSVFALVASPQWKGTRVDTEFRHSIASFVLHRMQPSIAQMLIPAEEVRDIMRLDVGEVIAHTFTGSGRGYVPMTEKEQLAAICQQYRPATAEIAVDHAADAGAGETRVLRTEPTVTEAVHAIRGYNMLAALQYEDKEIINMLALHLYGQDKNGPSLVRRAMELAEEHGIH